VKANRFLTGPSRHRSEGVLLVALAGAVAAWLASRGPVTTREALVAVAAALLVGLGAASHVSTSRSTWSKAATKAAGRETLARQWFNTLDAPSKEYLVFDESGHTPPYDEPGRFADLMTTLLTATDAGSS
jgi:pimeloyl-ACP methyl ester carboxylesterase